MTLLMGFGLSASVFLVAGTGDNDPEMQLEAAIHREMVRGDLAGAIEQYRAIAARRPVSRAVAAQALLHMGQCFEKLGRRAEANRAYARIAAEYADQTEVVARAHAHLAAREEFGPRNLNFEQGVPGKVPPGWFVPSLPKDGEYAAELRRSGCRSRIGCAAVAAPPNAPSPVGNLMQSFSAGAYKGKTVRLRAWLRLEPSRPEESLRAWLRLGAFGPEDRAQMWLRIDRTNRQNGFLDTMDDRPVRSAEWTRCEIVSPVFEDATFINLGVMAIGRGRVWVDDVSFDVISNSEAKSAPGDSPPGPAPH
jgi:hypothetical protein